VWADLPRGLVQPSASQEAVKWGGRTRVCGPMVLPYRNLGRHPKVLRLMAGKTLDRPWAERFAADSG
jgi:hypothetical protein